MKEVGCEQLRIFVIRIFRITILGFLIVSKSSKLEISRSFSYNSIMKKMFVFEDKLVRKAVFYE